MIVKTVIKSMAAVSNMKNENADLEQMVEIDKNGSIRIRRSSFAGENGLVEKTCSEEDVAEILEAMELVIEEKDNEFLVEQGIWNLKVDYDDGTCKLISGSLCFEGSSSLTSEISSLIRKVSGESGLYLFDGNPALLNKAEVEYIIDEEDGVYTETFVIDGEKDIISIITKNKRGGEYTRIYKVPGETGEILECLTLDDIEKLPEERVDCSAKKRRYRVRVEDSSGNLAEAERPFDKDYIPTEWSMFSYMIAESLSEFDECPDIFNSIIYGRNSRKDGEMTFAKVNFRFGTKEYTYICDNDICDVGDTVIVPAGHYNELKRVTVKNIEFFKKESAPYPVSRLKKVLKKYDERTDFAVFYSPGEWMKIFEDSFEKEDLAEGWAGAYNMVIALGKHMEDHEHGGEVSIAYAMWVDVSSILKDMLSEFSSDKKAESIMSQLGYEFVDGLWRK